MYVDNNGDGYGLGRVHVCYSPDNGYVMDGGDCNDANPDVNPGATEVYDGVDNDCDMQVDEGVAQTYYEYADGDGFGEAGSSVLACASWRLCP